MEPNKKRQLNAKIPAGLHTQMRLKAVERGLKIEAAVEEAIARWVEPQTVEDSSGKSPKSKYTNTSLTLIKESNSINLTASQHELVTKFARLLASGRPDLVVPASTVIEALWKNYAVGGDDAAGSDARPAPPRHR